MKFRFDFVTNSSSSSFACFNIYSIELYELVKRLIDSDKFIGIKEYDRYRLNWAWKTLSLIENDGLFGIALNGEECGNNYYSAEHLLCSYFEGLSPSEKQDISDFLEIAFLYRNTMYTDFKDQTDGYCGFSFSYPSKQIYERLLKIKHESLLFIDDNDSDTILIDCEYIRKNSIKEIVVPTGYKYFKLMYNKPPYGFKIRRNGFDEYDSSISCVEKFVLSDDIVSIRRNDYYSHENRGKNTGLKIFSKLKEVVLGEGIYVLSRERFDSFESLEPINIPSSIKWLF